MENPSEKEIIRARLKQEGKDSANNSEEDEAEREKREEKEAKEVESLIEYDRLGGERCPVRPDMEEIEYSMSFRIPKIEGLSECKGLKV